MMDFFIKYSFKLNNINKNVSVRKKYAYNKLKQYFRIQSRTRKTKVNFRHKPWKMVNKPRLIRSNQAAKILLQRQIDPKQIFIAKQSTYRKFKEEIKCFFDVY